MADLTGQTWVTSPSMGPEVSTAPPYGLHKGGEVCLEGKGNGPEPLLRVSAEDPMAEGPSLPPFLPRVPKPGRSRLPSVYRQLLGDVASAWDEMWRNESGSCDVGFGTGMLGFPAASPPALRSET